MNREGLIVKKAIEIDARTDVALEIFAKLIKKCRIVLEEEFGKPTSYYDAERQRVLSLAHDIFASSVTIEDILEMSKDRPSPAISDVTVTQHPHAPKVGTGNPMDILDENSFTEESCG